jgi:hypothetical protein
LRQEGAQMKVQGMLVGVLFCMAAKVAGNPSHGAPPSKFAPWRNSLQPAASTNSSGSTSFSTVKW